jgi:amino acid transporter
MPHLIFKTYRMTGKTDFPSHLNNKLLAIRWLAKEPKAFLREATGLVRGIGPLDALVFAIGAVIGPTWIPILVAEWSFYPGVSIPASFILTAALGGIWGLYYVVITALFPRSGGGSYVPLSRTISPALGMMMSFGYIVALSLTLGYVASTILPVAIASPLQTYAVLTNNPTLQSFATAATSPTWTVLSGTIFLAIGALIAIFGRRVTLTVNKIAFVLGTLGFLTIIYVFATTSQASFEAAFNTFVGKADAYQSISATAHANGFSPAASWVGPTLLSLPFSLFAILGFQSPSFFSGEIRKPSRSMLFAVIGAVIYGGFMYALVATLMQNSLGSDFVTSASYLFNVSPANYNLSFPPYANAFITIINPSPIINILVLVSIISFGYLKSPPLLWEALEVLQEKLQVQEADAYTNFLSSMCATQGEALGDRLVSEGQAESSTVLVSSLGAQQVELTRPQLRAIVSAYG